MEEPSASGSQERTEIIEAMARAAWWSTGEPQPWAALSDEVRREWMSYQEAALKELENRIPEIRRLIRPN